MHPTLLRGLASACLLAALAGCQAQNPFAAFGPHRVPPPGMHSPAPYYPAGAGPTAAAAPASPSAASGRISVSASEPVSAPAAAATADDIAQQSPIRIVENLPPAARTAAAPRGITLPQPPATSSPAPPAGGNKSSRIVRADSNVAPAAYEAPVSPGQWKAR